MPALVANSAKRKALPAPLSNAFAYRVDEVPLMGGPKRTMLYKMAKEGKIKLIKVGGRTLVDGDALRALLRGDA